jgi:HAD superfamily hydrolase (TIGR01549 family)
VCRPGNRCFPDWKGFLFVTLAAPRPIRLVTFDLYDTLIELAPQRWERLGFALDKLGVAHDIEALRISDVHAEDYYTRENAKTPIRDLPKDEQEAFRIEYMRQWLEAAGISADFELAKAARHGYRAELDVAPQFSSYLPYSDVVESAQRLREAGVKRAIISNADADVTAFVTHLAIAHEMDLIVTSAVVGYEKPDIRTFQAAFEPLGIDPAEALHIGDQPRSDVVGALNAGMRAALIDRYARHDQANHEVPVMRDFDTLVNYVIENNTAAGYLPEVSAV